MIKNFVAVGAIAPFSIVKYGATDGVASQSAAILDNHIGVTGELGAIDGQKVDVYMDGYAEVKLGATVARGELITSDAAGLGIELTDAQATTGGAIVVGDAMASGVVGDIIPFRLCRHRVG
jgi:hypothetical protein